MSCKYLVIDTETTGFHPSRNGLMQIALAGLDSKLEIIQTLVFDVNPPKGVEINPESLEITGFTLDRIEKGISYDLACQKLLDFIKTNFEKKPICVGQFYPFDYAFLENMLTSSGYGYVIDQDLLGHDFIDTKALANIFNLKMEMIDQKPFFVSTSLSNSSGLKDKLKIEPKFKAHDALGDVLATREVLLKMIEYVEIKEDV